MLESERPIYYDLPPIEPGAVIHETENFRVVTDYIRGLEGKSEGERFYIDPKTHNGFKMLEKACIFHNYYDFEIRPVNGKEFFAGEGLHDSGTNRIFYTPCLRVPYASKSLDVLLCGKVEIPKEGESSIPSPERMEECLKKGKDKYCFDDAKEDVSNITNFHTRHLRLSQKTYSKEIPSEMVHSDGTKRYSQCRQGWFQVVISALEIITAYEELTDKRLLSEVDSFKKFVRAKFTRHDTLTTPEDIQRANELIDKIWEHSQKSTCKS